MEKQNENSGKRILTSKQLSFCAMAVCLGVLLSNVKLFHFPTGGSITLLSMLVVSLPGSMMGLVPGLMAGVAYGILQLIIDPYILFPVQLIVDYILAFGVMGLSGLMYNKKNGILKGYIIAIIGRFIFSVISGWLFFGEYAWEGWGALPYSLVYNAIYIFSEGIITIVILCIPAVKNVLSKISAMVNG